MAGFYSAVDNQKELVGLLEELDQEAAKADQT
jgi:hypothetical protein